MYEPNQNIIPDAFMALYSKHGRPTASREHVEARHDLCEDMAAQMTTLCASLEQGDLPKEEVLRRCWMGLLADGSGVEPPEAHWVVARTAELLEWPQPGFLQPAA
ncbi:hypothetical protein [Pseudorhodoferax sp. Leaf267]|uniref:hypothetical protein n=1 Tax=Pseudorhodoferax sp. Leaf267 TaxID=1736316 RepID=UPI0006FAB2F4|nr:hypothetical protein [Pseudorhodoferax sp. Leaf267]KQP11809.1 hypothetical protein ASF43_22885 [Pseudorhodoferax sp. Leaf267]